MKNPYNKRKVYILYINDLYVDVRCLFVLTKVAKKQWQWISLDKQAASDNYVTGVPVPKWKALRWGEDMGKIKCVRLV